MRFQDTLAMTSAVSTLLLAIPQAASAAEEGYALEEIVVTAQKRTERLQDVPVSITAVDAAGLAEKNAVRLQDYLNDAPGVSIAGLGNGRQSVVIRGITTGFGNNPTTGVTIDDVPFGSSTSTGLGDALLPDLDPADLQRIEVLRGPQGTLYGASSMGGLVKFVTKDPDLAAATARVQLDTSSVEHGEIGYGARVSGNVPVIEDRLAIRASGFYRQDAGVIDDTLQNREDINSGEVYGGRVGALWNLAPGVDLRLSALMQNTTADASGTQDVRFNGQPIYGDLIHRRLAGTDEFDAKVRFYSATLTADFGATNLTSITGYGEIENNFPQDVTGTFRSFTIPFYGSPYSVRVDNGFETSKFSQEVRLASASNKELEWQVGAFYTRERTHTALQIYPVDGATGQSANLEDLFNIASSSTFEEYAGFADLTYYFTDRFDITVGARYGSNEREYGEVDTGLLVGPEGFVEGSSSDSSTTYLITPRFRISDDLMAYVRVASGYRVGGPNSGAPAGVPETFDADETVNYEAGFKGTLLDRRVSFDAAVFYIDWSDIQIRQVDPNTGSSFYGNGGTAESKGMELSAQFLPFAGTTLSASASFTDAKLTEDGPPGVYAPAGARLPNSSKWNGTVSAQQEFDLTNTLTAFGNLSVSYVGDRLAAFNRTASAPRFEVPSYTLLDMQFGVRADRWTGTLFLRNLTDKRGYMNATPLDAIGGQGAFSAVIIQPRTIGVSLVTEF